VSSAVLAKSIEPNADRTQWTITLRDGVKFTTARRSTRPRSSSISTRIAVSTEDQRAADSFVFQTSRAWTSAAALGRRDHEATWPAFSRRCGDAATAWWPAQLNDPTTCATNLIGPVLPARGVAPNESLTVRRNADYWRKVSYLDAIVFRRSRGQQRENGLLAGDFDLTQHSGALQILDLRDRASRAR